jgi:hypothetical protein
MSLTTKFPKNGYKYFICTVSDLPGKSRILCCAMEEGNCIGRLLAGVR